MLWRGFKIHDNRQIYQQSTRCVYEIQMSPAATVVHILNVLHFYLNPLPGMCYVCVSNPSALSVQVWLLCHHPNLKYCALSGV